MRRLTVLLAAAAFAASGVAGTASADQDPEGHVCTDTACVCVTLTRCSPIDKAPPNCVRVDLNDDGVYEELCV